MNYEISGIMTRFFVEKGSEGKMIKDTVYLSPVFLIVGIVDVVFFLGLVILMWLFPNDTAEPWIFAVFGAFALLGAVLIVACLLWRIEYNDVTFNYRSWLGNRTTIPYSSISRIKQSSSSPYNTAYLYTGKKRYSIYPYGIGAKAFLKEVSVHYRKDA